MNMNGTKMPPPTAERRVAAAAMMMEDGGAMSAAAGPLAARGPGWKADATHVALRLLCMISSAAALSFMVTARQSSTVSIYGFMLPVHSKWSFSHSFEYLVGVSAAVAAHSLLQLVISMSRLLGRSPLAPSKSHAWLIFAADQVFAYAMMSAGAAASGVTNLNRTGIQHTALPNFCKPLNKFCDHVAVAIVFTFFGFFSLAATAVQEVIWLSKSKY